MARKLDFKIDQGTDSALSFYPFWGKEIDLTGYRAAMQVRARYYSEEAVDTLTTENGRLVIDVASGKVTAQFPHEATVKYPARECVYDIELISADSKIYRVLEGKIQVSAEVTRVRISP